MYSSPWKWPHPTAAVFASVAPHGYNAEIRLLIGISPSGTVTGVRSVSHRETPGLGDAIEVDKSDWIRQFDGTSLQMPPLAAWAVRKDEGGQFDSLTGATVTSRAVVNAVKNTLLYFDRHRDEIYAAALSSRAMYPQTNDYRTLVADGLWRNNLALVQLLGLCPLLAVTTTLVNGLALGLATTAVLTMTNAVISTMRKTLVPIVRIPLFVLIIASLVTCIDLLTNALLDDLHVVLGLFIPLIVTNCAVLAQAETVASRKPVGAATLSGFATGLGFLGALTALGALRELFGQGTIFANFPLLFGERAAGLRIELPFDGMLVAVLPPGAFFGMAILACGARALDPQAQARCRA